MYVFNYECEREIETKIYTLYKFNTVTKEF